MTSSEASGAAPPDASRAPYNHIRGHAGGPGICADPERGSNALHGLKPAGPLREKPHDPKSDSVRSLNSERGVTTAPSDV